ncbi:MAG TPA: glycosyltransferase, partial [Negativicutes bacterium]|nr:glycosyltransferase [Negativicutes bacterium]
VLYTYSIIAATFLLTRYLFGAWYRPVPIDKDFTPGVTIIVPCFNEEPWIQRTIAGCINQDYPLDKLEVIVVDDCSNDRSYDKIKELVEELKSKEKRFHIEGRLHYIRQERNAGKRDALAKGARLAKHELVVFVDSDSFLDPFAIRNLVQPFKDTRMGGVSGRTDVANTYTNALTKMQAVRYYIAFRIMKAAESYFDAVTCLSGPLSCYRKELVLKYMDAWLNQKFLGQKATFGDDRSMTNFILREHRTGYQDTAICNTIVPNTHHIFLRQQMRWKRSWLRESLIAAMFMWKKEPFMSLSFYMGLLVPILAPVIVLYNLLYIPLTHRVFPFTFIFGIFLMASLMSMAQLFLRKSSTWLFGVWFCVYYEAVLLWQMPIAWFTFWKTTWGTRMTPADIVELFKKNRRKQKRAQT